MTLIAEYEEAHRSYLPLLALRQAQLANSSEEAARKIPSKINELQTQGRKPSPLRRRGFLASLRVVAEKTVLPALFAPSKPNEKCHVKLGPCKLSLWAKRGRGSDRRDRRPQ